MRRLLGTLALIACASVGTAPALAQAPHCDSYSGACVEGNKNVRPPAVRPSRGGTALPLTGGEIVTLLVAGGGAVTGGSVLVAAGRRRRTAS